MPWSQDFNYEIFRGGQEGLLKSEEDCPYPKIRLPESGPIERTIKDAFSRYPPHGINDTASLPSCFAFNFELIASDDLFVNKEVCGYHLARAVSGLLLELQTGFASETYDEFSPALHAIVEEWTYRQPEVAELAHSCLRELLSAAGSGGAREFFSVSRHIQDQLFPAPPRRGLFGKRR